MAQTMRHSEPMLSAFTGEYTARRSGTEQLAQPTTAFGGLSLNLKLPLFAAGLVLFVGIALATAAILEMRRTSFAVASGRLLSVTAQFDDLFHQSVVQAKTQVAAIASNGAIVQYAIHRSAAARATALAQLTPTAVQAPTLLGAELRDASGAILLSGVKDPSATKAMSLVPEASSANTDSSRIGAFRLVGDTVFYPVAADVHGASGVQVVQWRRLVNQAKSRNQLQQLIGSGARLFLGNANGSLWTDLQHAAPPLPVVPSRPARVQLAARPNQERQLVTALPIGGSPWMFAIAFPERNVLEPLRLFVYRLGAITLGGMLVAILAAWYASRRITHPLKRLTVAADRISAGEQVEPTRIGRRDELGRLSYAFDSMMTQVRNAERSQAAAEQELRRANEQLESRVRDRTRDLEVANKELETFSYSVSHDLRTPLRALDGFSQALLDDYGTVIDETGRGYLNRIRRGSQRMSDLIDAMLQLSRVSRGEVRRQPVNLSALARDTVESLRLTHPDRRVKVTVADGLEVTGDAALLRTLLGNLFGNAWKFTAKSPDACIEFVAAVDGDRGRVFRVRDNGVGFDMTYSNKLFGAFQRLHSNAEFDGTGIGLATAQRIVHRHGGDIWAEAQPNAGASFFFTLG